MKEELKVFFTALMFYTRIPCPSWVDHSEEYLVKSVRYLPFIGWIVGGISAVILIGFSFVLPPALSIVFAMVASILVTGAFHEDGLADACDAFGGGWTKEKILAIMKDSRIGTYGVVALILILITKFMALSAILDLETKPHMSNILFLTAVLVSGNSLSRFIALSAVVTHQYVRENDDNSKAKPVVKKNLKWFELRFLISGVFGILPLFYFQTPYIFIVAIAMYLFKVYLMRFFNKWIGGYTGDCLGAIQQLTEVIFYIGLIVLWKFI